MKNFFIILLILPLWGSAYIHFIPPSKFKVINYHWANYYVSTTGNDSNPGTIGSPFLTIYHATQVVTSAGNTINIAAGTYSETSAITLAAGVSLLGADSATTIIKSNVSADYTPLMNMSSAQGTNGNQSVSFLKFDGQLTNFLAIMIGGRSNVSIHDCSFRDFKDRGIIFSAKGDYTDGAPSIYATDNSFYNNRVLNCGRYIHPNGLYGMGCLNIGGQTGLTVHDNVIIQNQRASGDNGWPIKYANEGHNRGLKIYNNTLIKNKFLGDYNGDNDWDFAVELWYTEGGCEIYGNTIEGAIDMAYNQRISTYSYSFYIHNNTLSQPTLNAKFQGGVYTEREVEIGWITDNIMDKIAGGVIINIEDFGAGTYQHVNGLKIQKNLMSDMGRDIGDGNNGFGVGVFTHPTATFNLDSLLIDNNTMVAASGDAPFEGIYLNIDAAVGASNNIFVRNNIIQGFVDYSMRVSNSASTMNIFKFQNNNLYLNAHTNDVLFANGNPSNLTKTGNLGIPSGSNPLFVGGSDYTLQVTSPCIDAGIDVGLPYFNTAPDIGYAEYGSNIYPTADAGSDTTIVYPTSSLTITGSGTDGDGTIVSKLWTVVSGSATITNGTTYSPTFSNISGNVTVRLTVTDNDGATGSDDRQIFYVPAASNIRIVDYILGRRY